MPQVLLLFFGKFFGMRRGLECLAGEWDCRQYTIRIIVTIQRSAEMRKNRRMGWVKPAASIAI